MNTKVNDERPGSACNAQVSIKFLQGSYSIESMDNDSGYVVVNFNLEDMVNNYNTWNHLTALE